MAPNLIKFGKNTTGIGKRLINPGKHDCFDLDNQFSSTCEQIRTLQKCEEVWRNTRKTDQVR